MTPGAAFPELAKRRPMKTARALTGTTIALTGAAIVLTGAGVMAAGRWLFPADLHDTEDTDPCAAGTCHHWEQITLDHGDTVHLIPLNDTVPHSESDDCVCGPTIKAVFDEDGSNRWLHTHHSLDNREATE